MYSVLEEVSITTALEEKWNEMRKEDDFLFSSSSTIQTLCKRYFLSGAASAATDTLEVIIKSGGASILSDSKEALRQMVIDFQEFANRDADVKWK